MLTELKALFTGDTLFSAGCGRLFEASAEQMLASLTACASLGDDVMLYAGHEYTEENLRFALSIDSDNPSIKTRLVEARNMLRDGRPTLPSLLSVEKAVNPFLRTNNSLIRKKMRMETAPEAAVFAALRKLKDNY